MSGTAVPAPAALVLGSGEGAAWLITVAGAVLLLVLALIVLGGSAYAIWYFAFRAELYRNRPAEFTHRCPLPRRATEGTRWSCPVCDCPWTWRRAAEPVSEVRQADSRPPPLTGLERHTKATLGGPRWYFDHETYRERRSAVS